MNIPNDIRKFLVVYVNEKNECPDIVVPRRTKLTFFQAKDVKWKFHD